MIDDGVVMTVDSRASETLFFCFRRFVIRASVSDVRVIDDLLFSSTLQGIYCMVVGRTDLWQAYIEFS